MVVPVSDTWFVHLKFFIAPDKGQIELYINWCAFLGIPDALQGYGQHCRNSSYVGFLLLQLNTEFSIVKPAYRPYSTVTQGYISQVIEHAYKDHLCVR